ncbi:hypothetical protein [Bacillus sp. FJAT-45350]|uniref:hypothetical protein n=1 Tax=Bacillus sp. FJAT-45350 TaxID=2011014 RepID=UPI000BB7D7C6|nr:hypothetical protein [Bacillus sp. FJAT-45350]
MLQFNMKLKAYFLLFITFFGGTLFGFMLDKGWVSDQQLTYIQSVKMEKDRLENENQQWLSYVSDELKRIDIYLTEDVHDSNIKTWLNHIGVEAKQFDTMETLLEKEGFLITVGQELDSEYDLPQLVIDAVPDDIYSAQQFYLSLLRIKGENFSDEG